MKGLGIMARGMGFLLGIKKCSKIYCGDGFIDPFELYQFIGVYFEWMNSMVCELYLNKSVKTESEYSRLH